jgi:1,4-dihydroxy-2-naphthoyl-CoA synthase
MTAPNPMHAQYSAQAGQAATHFHWACQDGVATVTLNRPERKNPLTFDSYAELRDLFRALSYSKTIKSVVITGAGGKRIARESSAGSVVQCNQRPNQIREWACDRSRNNFNRRLCI